MEAPEPWQEPVSERQPQSNAVALLALGHINPMKNPVESLVSGWRETASILMRRLLQHSEKDAFHSSDAAISYQMVVKVSRWEKYTNKFWTFRYNFKLEVPQFRWVLLIIDVSWSYVVSKVALTSLSRKCWSHAADQHDRRLWDHEKELPLSMPFLSLFPLRLDHCSSKSVKHEAAAGSSRSALWFLNSLSFSACLK